MTFLQFTFDTLRFVCKSYKQFVASVEASLVNEFYKMMLCSTFRLRAHIIRALTHKSISVVLHQCSHSLPFS